MVNRKQSQSFLEESLGTGAVGTFFGFASPSFEFYSSEHLKSIFKCNSNCLKKETVRWSRKGLENSLIGLCSPLRLKKSPAVAFLAER